MTVDIQGNLSTFRTGRAPGTRYASFDYCFNHFQQAREDNDTARLANEDHLLLSCLQLGFYVASWGMMRGSRSGASRHSVPVLPRDDVPSP